MPASRHTRRPSDTLTLVNLPASTVAYQNEIPRFSLESVPRDHDEYRGKHSGPSKADREVCSDDVSSKNLLEKEFV